MDWSRGIFIDNIQKRSIASNDQSRRSYRTSSAGESMGDKDMQADYYKVLGIEDGASPSDVKAGYIKLAKLYHPDQNGGHAYESHEIFLLISEAYDVLSNPILRKSYDESRMGTGKSFDAQTVSRGHSGYKHSGQSTEHFFDHEDDEYDPKYPNETPEQRRERKQKETTKKEKEL